MVGCNGEHNSFWNGRKITILRDPVHIEVNCEFLLLFIKNHFNKKWLWYLYAEQQFCNLGDNYLTNIQFKKVEFDSVLIYWFKDPVLTY